MGMFREFGGHRRIFMFERHIKRIWAALVSPDGEPEEAKARITELFDFKRSIIAHEEVRFFARRSVTVEGGGRSH